MSIEEILKTPIAHRGLHADGVPENSLAAFRAAIDASKGIECDVRILSDGSAVIFHDRTLTRMVGEKAKIAEKKLSDLQELFLDNTQEKIPTLNDVLTLVSGKVPLIVELKTFSDRSLGDARILGELLKDYNGPMIVSSFSSRAVKYFSEQEFLTGQTFRQKTLTARMTSILKWFLRGRHGDVLALPLSYKSTFLESFIRSVSEAPVLYWTARSEEEKNEALKDGGVIYEG